MRTLKVNTEAPRSGAILSINGKQPSKVIRVSAQYKPMIEPFKMDGIEYPANFGKVFTDITDGRLYLIGHKYAWELVEETNN